MSDESGEILSAITAAVVAARNTPPIGTPDNPYVVYVPKWFEIAAAEEGVTPQQVYDKVFGNGSFRNGRVEVIEEIQ